MTNLNLYKIFCAVAKEKNISRASEQLYVSQPAVSFSIKELEKELDSGFTRVGRSMIVNLNRIRRVTKAEVMLNDGTALPLPRGAYEPLNRAIIQNT